MTLPSSSSSSSICAWRAASARASQCAVCLLQFFRQHGWRQPEVTGYARMAAATEKPAEIFLSECAPDGLHDKMCPFIQAHI